jgi:hypothetical protein
MHGNMVNISSVRSEERRMHKCLRSTSAHRREAAQEENMGTHPKRSSIQEPFFLPLPFLSAALLARIPSAPSSPSSPC